MIGFAELLGRSSRTIYGTWVKIPSIESVELLALAGFDFLVLDMEHAPLDLGTVHRLIGAARGSGLPALVRVPDRSSATISRVLDSGAAGVLVPHVDTVQDAMSVVSAARFPPVGARGYGPTVRSGSWGADPDAYRRAADAAVVVPQLESRAAIELAASIGEVDGIDALFVGPADLAIATGLEPGSTALAELIGSAEAAAADLALPIGTAVGTNPAAAAEVAGRYDFVLVGNDASLLHGAASSLLDAVTNA